ncbi:MAG: helix-turn-helix domain-containing protein [Candidatus Methylomirabilales bacterium]
MSRVEANVLILLAAFASAEGRAFPSVETIRRLTGHARSTIFEALTALKGAEILKPLGRVKRKAEDASGPVVYGIAEPPVSQIAYHLCVRELRTHRRRATVRGPRTHRLVRNARGQFAGAPRYRPSPTDPPRPSPTDTERSIERGAKTAPKGETGRGYSTRQLQAIAGITGPSTAWSLGTPEGASPGGRVPEEQASPGSPAGHQGPAPQPRFLDGVPRSSIRFAEEPPVTVTGVQEATR